jgi:hypothetical protein
MDCVQKTLMNYIVKKARNVPAGSAVGQAGINFQIKALRRGKKFPGTTDRNRNSQKEHIFSFHRK